MECSGEDAEELFFDSREEVTSFDWSSDGTEECISPPGFVGYHNEDSRMRLDSVFDRRKRFLDWMKRKSDSNSGSVCDRPIIHSGAVLRTSNEEDDSPTQFLASSPSREARRQLDRRLVIRNLDDGTEFVVDEVDSNGMICRLRQVGSNFSVTLDEFQRTIGQSPLTKRLFSRYAEEVIVAANKGIHVKEGWLKKVIAMPYAIDRYGKPQTKVMDEKKTTRKMKVSPYKKRSQELSSLFTGQEFLAHKGSIGTMKFSSDGLFLASGGEDGIVRVWKVYEDEKFDQFNGLERRCSCPYCTFQSYFMTNKETETAFRNQKKKNTDETCTILPRKMFKVQEEPLYEFHGHEAEILDLSWSKKRHLLSASADNTVRLWQVGSEVCLGVFSHTNYVTSVDFNPLDDNYFISGSIDGKVRIWEVPKCRVVGYSDIKEIVTVVRYRPSGKEGLVGSVSGRCFFYNLVDNQMHLDTDLFLHEKKNLRSNRITGFQFSPRDSSKVIVTCADSAIRILTGSDVSCKFKVSGFRVPPTQNQASFTSDGQHIVSLGKDSKIYLWNYNNQTSPSSKTIKSHESFLSENAVVAIPWSGIQTDASPTGKKIGDPEQKANRAIPEWFSFTRGFLLESLAKGSACLNKEKLPIPSISRTKCMAHYKLLKNACHHMLNTSHMWGLVIVTAGLDGRIRTYLNYGLPLRL